MESKNSLIPFLIMLLLSLRSVFVVFTERVGKLETWRICFSLVGFLFFAILFFWKLKSLKT